MKKICPRCKVNEKKGDYCISCNREKSKEYRNNYPERCREYKNRYHEKSRDKLKLSGRIYYYNHIEKERKRKKEYYEKNPTYNSDYYKLNKEKIIKNTKEYKDNNKEKVSNIKKEWYNQNKQLITNGRKEYYKKNKKIIIERNKINKCINCGKNIYHKSKRCINCNKEILKKLRAKRILPVKDTSIEIKIQNFLKQLNIEFFTHQYIKIEHGYQCDILIPSMNMVIECDGDYWHKYPIGREIDNIRTKELLNKGFKVLRLWESEIKNMDLNYFKEKLK